MRWIPDNQGRFRRRPHYEAIEIDRECEQLVAIFRRDLGMASSISIETDDLHKLIERHVEDLDVYADLSADGSGVEGVTLFVQAKRPSVEISSRLTEDERRHNRYRTTLTHELGHVRLHDHLFQEKLATGDLFSPRVQERLACKRDTMVQAPATDWMEWQACYFSGAILMPRSAMIAVAREKSNGISGAPRVGTEEADLLVRTAMDRFAVSFDAAKVRFSVLGLLKDR